MKSFRHPKFPSPRPDLGLPLGVGSLHRRNAGMALIVTLSLLVLVTFAVMAFFTRATSNRQVEAVRSQQVLADQVVKSAESHVVGLFLAELKENATNKGTDQNPIYLVDPTKPEAMVPERKVAPSSERLSPVLRRQSVVSADPAVTRSEKGEKGLLLLSDANPERG